MSEIAERTAREIVKHFRDDENLPETVGYIAAIVERAIAESQAPQPSQLGTCAYSNVPHENGKGASITGTHRNTHGKEVECYRWELGKEEDEKFAADFVDVFGGFPKDQAISLLIRRQREIRR